LLNYEALRNLIVDQMADDGWRPTGMTAVLVTIDG